MEKNQPPLIIAELGTSHGGDPGKALELIAAAAESGADCVKCQIIYAAEILHPKTGTVPLPGGEIPLYEAFARLERGPDFYGAMKEEAENRGLLFLATPFGLTSAAVLRDLGPKAVKIASPELNYTALLEETASWGVPLYLSCGVATLGDIEEALSTVSASHPAEGSPPVTLLHCVTAYPAPAEDYNLRVLPHLRGIFGVPLGVSDHSADPALVPVLAAVLGAAAIEKHLCLSRSGPGLDDPVALDPGDFARMCRRVRSAAAGAGERGRGIIGELEEEFGPELVEKTLGTGRKVLAPSEKANYGRTNRSIHALRDIAAGEIISRDMIGILRTEKVLRPGLPPRWERLIAGRRARHPIPAGEGIRFEDI
ncbi:MAG: N-acetylneuraminate synthase family protein [Treponema sp.]|jgi:sialic acid synthase SpsE|nr:N-acetylneuraminate synthase family protein [Treponema sp.]